VLGLAGVLVAAGAVGLLAARSGGPPAGAVSQQRPGPVLLVPGYGGSRESLSALAARIRSAGREAEVLTLPGDGTGDLAAQAAVLAGRVADAVARGAPSVDVIGYSAGGVVVRVWVARDETARFARRVVTLGSPLHGARIAAAGGVLAPGACPMACQQLTPGSALLRELDGEPLPRGLPWLSIWTEDDETVTPPDSARLAGAVNVSLQRSCPGVRVGHGQLPTDPLVVGLVLRGLGTGPLSEPRPDDCAALRAEGLSS
jgi:triacylglycerol lipase